MKPRPLLIGIIVVLVMLCSPVLAISTSDLISQFRPQGTGTGTLSVSSIPTGARVSLDGVDRGTTPVTITGVITGLHNLKVTLSGYEDYSSWVIIPNDKEVHVSLKARSGSTTIPTTVPILTPTTVPTTVPTGQLPSYVKTGSVSVSSTPPGARVSLDGVDRGTTPVTITGVPMGAHNLRVTLSGYEDYSSWVIIPSDKTVEVHVSLKDQSGSTTIPATVPTTIPTTVPTLTPTTVPTTIPPGQVPPLDATGTVSVSSTPTGARVYLDGYRGTTPVTITGVPVGFYVIRATHSGNEDWKVIFVQAGQTTTVTLTPQYPPPPPLPPGTTIDAKPNIYLYSDRDLTARVRLFPETAIMASDPPYRPGIGWIAEIRNGSLNGAGDFLFYEALGHDSGWQKQEGYIIRGGYREQDMAFMLGEYGFNEKETDEFIEYWACHLAGDSDYVFYPQETDAVNRNMPLSIIPEPDHVSRIKFYAEPLVSAPKPVTNPEQIVREGFYVVEWGVTLREEFLDI